jgi:hypothetical protein
MTLIPHVPVRTSELIRKELKDNYDLSRIPDNYEIAESILAALDAKYKDSYLRLYIAQEVGLIANNMRNEAILRTKSQQAVPPAQPVGIMHTATGAPKASPAVAGAVQRHQASIAAAVEDFLNRTIKVANGVTKFIKDCTESDLRAAADERMLQASRFTNSADMYIRIADKMLADSITTVSGIAHSDLENMVKGI